MKGRIYKGSSFRLSKQKGKAVLVDFWFTGCGPCRKTIPALVALQRRYGDNLLVLGANPFGEQEKGNFGKFLSDTGLDYPVLLTDRAAADQFRVEGYPTLFLIDKSGVLRERLVGFNAEKIEGLTGLIDAILKE